MAVSPEAAAPAPVRTVLREPGTAERAASADLSADGGAASLDRGVPRDHRPQSEETGESREGKGCSQIGRAHV